jgi:hypothetical protein
MMSATRALSQLVRFELIEVEVKVAPPYAG